MTELHYLSLAATAEAFTAGELSPVEVTEAVLARIGEVDGELHSFSAVLADAARVEAADADADIAAGRHRGPLHGVPVAVKDLCDVAGVATMAGTAVLRDNVASRDATVVSRLRDAGAVIVGKLNLTEGAMAGYHPDLDVPVNPWGENRWAGVSSSGSGAATAAGLCHASLGSDTGGSIRFPSAANGVVGIKPTYGRVSRHGVFPLAESLDHVGPITRCALDAAIVLEAIAGQDLADPTTIAEPSPDLVSSIGGGVEGVRIGLDRSYITGGADLATADAVLAAVDVLVDLGAEVHEMQMPAMDDSAWFVICAAEAAVAHAALYPARAEEYGPYLAAFLEQGGKISGTEFARAQQQRRSFAGSLEQTFQQVDIVACPSMHGPAFIAPPDVLRGTVEEVMSLSPEFGLDFTARFDLSGNPTISLPSGFDEQGMPLSVQFVGGHRDEALLCRVGHAFEQATPWHLRHPL